MRTFIACWLLLAMQCSAQSATDLDSLLSEVYGSPNNGTQAGAVVPANGNSNTQLNTGGGGFNLNPSNNVDTSCKTDDNQVGECVQYFLCSGNNTIITDGVGIIDIRVRDGPCESYLELCCLSEDRVEKPITPPPPVQPTPQGCGYRNPDGVGFRIKGDKDDEARFAEFPWMVALLKEELSNENNEQYVNIFVCGGSLINPSAVLSAAHCAVGSLQNGHKMKVRAGEWDTQTKNELYQHQDRDVDKVVVHEHYHAGSLFNDIALLILKEPVEAADNIGFACLPPPGRERVSSNARCFASGWGKDVFGKEGKYQVILKKVDLPVVARPKCELSLRGTRLGRRFSLHTSFMCAGGENGKDTCRGDGGSPLVCPIPGQQERYAQFGIVAWGIGCGGNGVPGVYADVSQFRDWVDEQMIYNRLDSSTYTY